MVAINYDWDELEDNIVEEYDDAGAAIANYTTEPDHFGNVISQHRGGQSSFFHYDGLGSTLAVTDGSQNVTDTRAYSAFGETRESTGGTTFPYQYVGEKGYYRDSLTGQYVVRRRPYEPMRGSWTAPDPIFWFDSLTLTSRLVLAALPTLDSLNLYSYARRCPVDLIDPSGYVITKCTCSVTTSDPKLRMDWIEYSTGLACSTICCGTKPLNVKCSGKAVTLDTNENALAAWCATVAACPTCSVAQCELFMRGILDSFQVANAAALGTFKGWLEEHGMGKYGGRCHLWSAIFLKRLEVHFPTLPPKGSCLSFPISKVIDLDIASGWDDHNLNLITNKCTGTCLIVDDGFWGGFGQVYDPCTVGKPPLMTRTGTADWNDILKSCGCPTKVLPLPP